MIANDLFLQLFSADGSVDTAFVTLFPTTYERASCQLHTLLCTGWLRATLINIYLSVLVVAILLVFAGLSAWETIT